MNSEEIKAGELCCDAWREMAGKFSWLSYQHQPDMYCMPHIKVNGHSLRVNFCPSCGKEIRSINMKKQDLV